MHGSTAPLALLVKVYIEHRISWWKVSSRNTGFCSRSWIRIHKTNINFWLCYMFGYVPNMEITQDVYGRDAGTNTNSVPSNLSRDHLLWLRVGWGISKKLLRFGLEIVNPLQEESVWIWPSQEASHNISVLLQTSTKTFTCWNCRKTLPPEHFCYHRVLCGCLEPHCILSLHIWKCTKLFLLCSEFLEGFPDKITLSSIFVAELHLDRMNAQALPEFQPVMRNSAADELCTCGVSFLPGEDQPGCMMLSLAEDRQQIEFLCEKQQFWSSAEYFVFCYWTSGLHLGS